LLAAVPEARGFVGAAAEIKIRQYVEDASDEGLAKAFSTAVLIPDLRPIVLSRLAEANDETLASIIDQDPSADYLDEAITRFESSRSFDSATVRFENLVLPLARLLTREQETKILTTYRTNNQAWAARAMAGLMSDFLNQRGQPAQNNKPEWKQLFDFVKSQAEWIPSSEILVTSIKNAFSFRSH
jgi:hypothetical protein